MRSFICLLPAAFAVTTLSAQSAYAAPRKVCWTLKLFDDRGGPGTDVPHVSRDGALRGAENLATIPAVGHVIELWDRDDELVDHVDDFIGRWISNGPGENCVTFEWENDIALAQGEWDPDVYLKYVNTVRRRDLDSPKVEAKRSNGNPHVHTTWRNHAVFGCIPYSGGNPCRIASGNALVPSFDPTNLRARIAMMLDTAQHTLELFGPIWETDHINMRFPCDGTGSGGMAGNNCSNSIAKTKKRTDITWGASLSDTPGHELGHLLHYDQFNQNGLWGNNCNQADRPPPPFVTPNESCATKEGFASFVGQVSLWDHQNANSAPTINGIPIVDMDPDPTGFGGSLPLDQASTTSCNNHGRSEYLVASAFWDMADTESVTPTSPFTGDDLLAEHPMDIAAIWAEFGNGVFNRQNDESQFGDNDGVNVRDFIFHAQSVWSAPNVEIMESVLDHRCMSDQDPG